MQTQHSFYSPVLLKQACDALSLNILELDEAVIKENIAVYKWTIMEQKDSQTIQVLSFHENGCCSLTYATIVPNLYSENVITYSGTSIQELIRNVIEILPEEYLLGYEQHLSQLKTSKAEFN